MTEGTGHVIDPDSDARRALLEAVAERGPEALSDATIMDNLCRNQLAGLPGEAILIVSAARADVPALLRDKIPELGIYGAIQSVAATLAPEAPYTEVSEFLAHNVNLIPSALDTLRYVDCALLARRVTAKTLMSVALMDDICPPSTVFAAYNEIPGTAKDIAVYPYSGHSVPQVHAERQLRHLREVFS